MTMSGGDSVTVRRRIRIKWFRLLLMCVIGYALYVGINQHLEYQAISRETEITRMHLEQLRQTQQSMMQEKQKLVSPEYVEKLAREELGLVKPGEVPYVR